MKFIDVYNNHRNTSLTGAQTWLINQLPGLTVGNMLDWAKFRQIAIACDEGHVYNLPCRFPDLPSPTLERAAELLCPNGYYY